MTRPDRVLLLCACLVLAGTVPARGEPPVGEAKPKVAAPGKGVRTDAYGDPLPQGAVARLGTVRFRHLKTIWALAYSPDGKMLAAADGDGVDSHRGLSWHGPAQGTIRLWDPATGKEIRRLTGHRGPIRRLAFSADGRLLMSLCEDVRLWDPATGKERELARVEGAVRCATLSSDGTMLAVGLEGQVRLLDVASGKEVRQFRFSGDFIQAVALSPDGKTMAAACKNSAHLCDVATGRELRKFSDASPGPKLAFSPDGKLLATAEYYRPVRLWDAGTCKQLHTLGRDGEGGNFFAFSPDSKALLAGPVDDTTLWDVATGKEIRRFGGKRGFQFAGAFAPDGKTLALSDDHAVRQFEVATGKELLPRTAHASDLDVLAFSPDGKTILTGADGLLAWDPATGKERMPFGSRATVGAAVYTPDGKTIVAGYHQAQAILLREAATGKELSRFAGQPGEVDFIALLAGSKSVVSMSGHRIDRVGNLWENRSDGSLRVWDMATGKETRQVGNPLGIEFGYRGIERAACSADGRLLAVGERLEAGPQVRVWDGASDREQAKLDQPDWVLALAFTPDGRRLVSAAFDPPSRFPIRLWEVASGSEVWRHVETEYATVALAVSPDGGVIAAGGTDGLIRLWDLATRKELRKLAGHQGPVLAVAFSADGRRLVSGGRDTTALIWDVAGVLPAVPATRLGAAEPKELWDALAAADAAAALKAVRRLALAPTQALPLIGETLANQPAADPARLARLVADLDASEFEKREAAVAELTRLGNIAEPALRLALEGKPSEDLRLRAEALLKKMDHRLKPAELQAVRALEVLELIATPDARKLIESLAKHSASPWVAEEATTVLKRLAKPVAKRAP